MASRVVNFTYFGLYLSGFLLFILSFSSPWWYERGNSSYGLFKTCYRQQYGMDWECTYWEFDQMSGAAKGSMAIMVIALVVNAPNMILCILVFAKDFSILISAIICGVGGFLTMLGVAIFGAEFDGDTENIGWAYALGCVSMGILIITSIAIILADRLSISRSSGRSSPRNQSHY